MKRAIELLLSFSSFSIHNSSFSFTYPLAAGGIIFLKIPGLLKIKVGGRIEEFSHLQRK
jgi:hypothetical protein